jgi:hypothetical protein
MEKTQRSISDGMTNADGRNQNLGVLFRHSGMPLAGIQSGAFLDSGQKRAGMTEG